MFSYSLPLQGGDTKLNFFPTAVRAEAAAAALSPTAVRAGERAAVTAKTKYLKIESTHALREVNERSE